MAQVLLWFVVALVVAGIVFGVFTLVTGGDPALEPVEPDGVAVPLPTSRPLGEEDVQGVRFDTALRGYRMSQVDQALRRTAYDIGYKDELIAVLVAEVDALRAGRREEADALRAARRKAARAGKPDAGRDTTPAPEAPAGKPDAGKDDPVGPVTPQVLVVEGAPQAVVAGGAPPAPVADETVLAALESPDDERPGAESALEDSWNEPSSVRR